MDRDRCRALCHEAVAAGQAMGPQRPLDAEAQTPAALTAGSITAAVAAGFAAMVPLAAEEIAADLERVPLVLDPATVTRLSGGTRAFTLEHGGRAGPVVLCPFEGKFRDAPILAHELGHALQYLWMEGDVAPILREMAAFLAELALIQGLSVGGSFEAPAQGPPSVSAPSKGVSADDPMIEHLRRLWDYQTWTIFERRAPALLAALDDPVARYDYGWNYPLARLAVLRLLPGARRAGAAHMPSAVLSVLEGTLDLSTVLVP